ncbi:hypothetical protein [Runella sp.]|uniref:hypothetical protein n=1 Tax=Runella sp. TaxID=1960881 RepID=UPI003D0EAE41
MSSIYTNPQHLYSQFTATPKSHHALMILGNMRSGASFVAKWLRACGLFIGDEFYRVTPENPHGYFEDKRFVRLQKAAREDQLAASEPLLPVDFIEEAQKLVAANSEAHSQWGWKAPQTCFFLDEWNYILPEAKAIIVFRPYLQVLDSWKRRHIEAQQRRKNTLSYLVHRMKLKAGLGSFETKHLKNWIMLNYFILQFLESKNPNDYVLIELDQLQTHDRQLFDHLTQKMGFSLNYTDIKEIYPTEPPQKEVKLPRGLPRKQVVEAERILRRLREKKTFA